MHGTNITMYKTSTNVSNRLNNNALARHSTNTKLSNGYKIYPLDVLTSPGQFHFQNFSPCFTVHRKRLERWKIVITLHFGIDTRHPRLLTLIGSVMFNKQILKIKKPDYVAKQN